MTSKTKSKFDFAGWPTKDYQLTTLDEKKNEEVPTVVELSAEVNGNPPGTKLQLETIQGNGAVFIGTLLTGLQHGQTLRVRATDIS